MKLDELFSAVLRPVVAASLLVSPLACDDGDDDDDDAATGDDDDDTDATTSVGDEDGASTTGDDEGDTDASGGDTGDTDGADTDGGECSADPNAEVATDCPDYVSCIMTSCSAEYEACYGDIVNGNPGGACESALQCSVDCNCDEACLQGCGSMFAEGDCLTCTTGIATCALTNCADALAACPTLGG